MGTKPLSVATLAHAEESFGAALTVLQELKDEDGRPIGVMPNVLLVPPALRDTARRLLTSEKLANGEDNPYKGAAEMVVEPRLISRTAWFVLDTTKPVLPFIYQERKAPVFVQQTDAEADDVFNRKKFKFGAEARAAGGYGFWQLAYGSTGTGE